MGPDTPRDASSITGTGTQNSFTYGGGDSWYISSTDHYNGTTWSTGVNNIRPFNASPTNVSSGNSSNFLVTGVQSKKGYYAPFVYQYDSIHTTTGSFGLVKPRGGGIKHNEPVVV
jgi:hypothetical protein